MKNIIRYDLYNGILKRSVWILLPIVIFAMIMFEIYATIKGIKNSGISMTLGEVIAYFWHGSVPAGSSLGATHQHIGWLLIQLGCICFTIEYPTRDLNIFGQQIIVRCGSRVKWWLSKCVWIAFSVMIYLFAGFFVFAVESAFLGLEMSLDIQQSSMMQILIFCNVGFGRHTGLKSFFILVIMPYLSMLALNLFCVIVSLICNQICSMITGLFALTIIARYMSPLIVTNYCMLQRCSYFYSDGVDYSVGIAYLIGIIAVLMIIGAMIMLYIDIIEPKKNGDA